MYIVCRAPQGACGLKGSNTRSDNIRIIRRAPQGACGLKDQKYYFQLQNVFVGLRKEPVD